MCGRFALVSSSEELLRHFGVAKGETGSLQRWNVAPSQEILGVSHDADVGGPACAGLVWGFLPPWAEATAKARPMINARAETLAERPSFRAAFRRRRAIIPVTAFYEWRRGPAGGEAWAFARQDHGLFGIAAIWGAYQRADQSVRGCALITVRPNELIAPIHDRMPAILAQDDYEAWLDPKSDDDATLAQLLAPCRAEEMDAWRVSAVVNNPRNDDARCLEPVAHMTEDLF